jgi:hypothetical protein
MIKSDNYEDIEAKYFELLGESVDLLDEVKEHTIIARRAMDSIPVVDANTLSIEVVELAILNQRLGTRVSKAGMIARSAEFHYKMVRENHKIQVMKDKKIAATAAESYKYELSATEFDLFNAAKGLEDDLSNMRWSTSDTIDAIRSKLSFEKSDYKNT